MKPALQLSKAEKAYWPIITRARTTTWSKEDTAMASILARNLATVEELFVTDAGDGVFETVGPLIRALIRRLKLSRDIEGDTMQHKITRAVLEELDG